MPNGLAGQGSPGLLSGKNKLARIFLALIAPALTLRCESQTGTNTTVSLQSVENKELRVLLGSAGK
jgi:hypothetical protein